jgi:hypothetical protein
MNQQESFHMPRQSFPTDVTSPTPTQLPSSSADESSQTHSTPPPKPPRPDRADESEEGEKRRGQIAAPGSHGADALTF